MELWAKDATEGMSPGARVQLFPQSEVHVHEDEVLHSLLTPRINDGDEMTKRLVERILVHYLEVLRTQLADQLEGGGVLQTI